MFAYILFTYESIVRREGKIELKETRIKENHGVVRLIMFCTVVHEST
jgi:hypothetical protein